LAMTMVRLDTTIIVTAMNAGLKVKKIC